MMLFRSFVVCPNDGEMNCKTRKLVRINPKNLFNRLFDMYFPEYKGDNLNISRNHGQCATLPNVTINQQK